MNLSNCKDLLIVFLIVLTLFNTYHIVNTKKKEHMSNLNQINAEALHNIASLYNTKKLVIDNLEVLNNVTVNGNALVRGSFQSSTLKANDLITGKRLNLIDGPKGNTHFNYGNKGDNYIRGGNNLIEGPIESHAITADYLAAKRLDVLGPKGITHFNYDNKGDNYIRGGIKR